MFATNTPERASRPSAPMPQKPSERLLRVEVCERPLARSVAPRLPILFPSRLRLVRELAVPREAARESKFSWEKTPRGRRRSWRGVHARTRDEREPENPLSSSGSPAAHDRHITWKKQANWEWARMEMSEGKMRGIIAVSIHLHNMKTTVAAKQPHFAPFATPASPNTASRDEFQ